MKRFHVDFWPRQLITLDDLELIGGTVIVFCILEFLHGLLR